MLMNKIEEAELNEDFSSINLHKSKAIQTMQSCIDNQKFKERVFSSDPPFRKPKAPVLEPQLVSVKVIIEGIAGGIGNVKDNWFSLLKAAAIYPHECDDCSHLITAFQFKHVHIQLAHASRLGYWEAHEDINMLGSRCYILPSHPIRKFWEGGDPVLKSSETYYKSFEIYSGDFKKHLGVFDPSVDEIENYVDFDSMTEEEKSQYLLDLFNIEHQGKAFV